MHMTHMYMTSKFNISYINCQCFPENIVFSAFRYIHLHIKNESALSRDHMFSGLRLGSIIHILHVTFLMVL